MKITYYLPLLFALLLAGCTTQQQIADPLPYQGDVLQCVVFTTSDTRESPSFEELRNDPNAEQIILPGVILLENQPQNINLFMPNGDELAITVQEYNRKYLKEHGTALVTFSYLQRVYSDTRYGGENTASTMTQRRQFQSSLMLEPGQWQSVGSVRNQQGGEYYFVRLTLAGTTSTASEE